MEKAMLVLIVGTGVIIHIAGPVYAANLDHDTIHNAWVNGAVRANTEASNAAS
ncbi:Uncharacterised protein [Cedecea neteri]|uniref:Uncharacterized protein n=1 Tax=Cedecea neteri TaxID=158822 RepID=A0A2X3IEW5_9ENTR|nr:Uncharacterised protein [Cedecea neteri]